MIERSLIIMKPTAVSRGISGEILARFERAGLKVVGSKTMRPTLEQYFYHYETVGTMITRHGEEIFRQTVEMMTSGPVIAYVLEWDYAVVNIRKLVGPTAPKDALPGTIRWDYSHMSREYANGIGKGIDNLIHASGSPEEAEMEIKFWFKDEELINY